MARFSGFCFSEDGAPKPTQLVDYRGPLCNLHHYASLGDGCGKMRLWLWTLLCVPYVGITSLIPLHFGLGYCPFPSEGVIQGFLGVLMCGREKVEGGEGGEEGGGDVREEKVLPDF